MRYGLKVLILILFAFSSLACVSAQESSLAPDFKLEDTSGQIISLQDYQHQQPLILIFWTTWCPFCREALKRLNDLYPKIKEDGVEAFAINVGEKIDKVKNFTQSYGLKFKILLDKNTAITGAYQVLGVPTYIFIDQKGDVVFKHNVFSQEEYQKLILK